MTRDQVVALGEFSVVSAGAVVTNGVPDGVLVAGAPARTLERAGEGFDWKRPL